MDNQPPKRMILSPAVAQMETTLRSVCSYSRNKEAAWDRFKAKYPIADAEKYRLKFRTALDQVWKQMRETKTPFNSEVKIRLRTGSDISGPGIFVMVMLRSNMKPQIWSKHETLIDLKQTWEMFEKIVMVTAGAVAEHQNTTLGDNHDPKEVGLVAVDIWHKIKLDLLKKYDGGLTEVSQSS